MSNASAEQVTIAAMLAQASIVAEVGDRIAAHVRDQGVTLPAVIVRAEQTRVLERANPALDSGRRWGDVTLEVFGATLLEAQAVALVVTNAMQGLVHNTNTFTVLGDEPDPAPGEDGAARGWPAVSIALSVWFTLEDAS